MSDEKITVCEGIDACPRCLRLVTCKHTCEVTCEAELRGFMRAVELLRGDLVYLDKWDGPSVADWLEERKP